METPLGRGLDKNADNVGITNNPGAGTQAGISWNEQGLNHWSGRSNPRQKIYRLPQPPKLAQFLFLLMAAWRSRALVR